MEAVDAASRQSFGLPSLTNLDQDRIRREDADSQRKHSMVSPLHPFSNHQSSPASAVPGPLGGLLSPPESRRTSGDEKDQQRAPARQSLPSIHEALGRPEPPLAFAPPAPVPPPSVPASAAQSYFPPPPPPTTTSPTEHRARAFSSDFHASQGPGNPFSNPRSPFIANTSSSAAPPPPPPQPQADAGPRPSFSEARPSFSEQRQYSSPRPSLSAPQQNPKLPALHPLRTDPSPPPGPGRPNAPYSTYPPHQSPAYESSGPHSAGPMNPNYGYSQYPPNYPLSAPAPGAPNSQYPPSAATYSAPPRAYPGTPSWPESRAEEKKITRSSFDTYGESVKRHLESFDLEASLNELAEGAGQIGDWSRLYRQRAHENQRIGLTSQSIPVLEEVDRMLKYSDTIRVALERLREVVYSNHQASMAEPPQEARYQRINGYDHEPHSNYAVEDVKVAGGFQGPDTKKVRRGLNQRAAPPGRCHSCNRAETPEWRRGPDGARTLCNACGLHYAKLTRKMGGKQAMTSSNLRPKTLDQGSPTV